MITLFGGMFQLNKIELILGVEVLWYQNCLKCGGKALLAQQIAVNGLISQ